MALKPNGPPICDKKKTGLLDAWCRTLVLDFLGPSTSLSPLYTYFLVCEIGLSLLQVR